MESGRGPCGIDEPDEPLQGAIAGVLAEISAVRATTCALRGLDDGLRNVGFDVCVCGGGPHPTVYLHLLPLAPLHLLQYWMKQPKG